MGNRLPAQQVSLYGEQTTSSASEAKKIVVFCIKIKQNNLIPVTNKKKPFVSCYSLMGLNSLHFTLILLRTHLSFFLYFDMALYGIVTTSPV